MSDARPRLTILSPLAPYPSYSGGAAHLYRSALGLTAYYRVSLYALAAEPEGVRWGALQDRCEEACGFRSGPRGGSILDPPAARMERSAELERHLDRVWSEQPPDVVQIEFTTMAHYAPLARTTGALVACTAHNVAFLAQVQRARRERSPALRMRRWLGALSLWRYELRTLRHCNLAITLSERDATALRGWLPGLPVVCVAPGVEIREQHVAEREKMVLFVGSYLHPPNVEGATWLARAVWPVVRRAVPGARLVLAGRDPPADVRALATDDIVVPGTLPDLAPLYARASIAAAAVFWGGGVRIKILDALAAGLPVVATPAAAAGLALVHGKDALIAADATSFANELVRLLEDAGLRERIGAAGHEFVLRRHDTMHSARLLAGVYEGARAALIRSRTG